MPHVLEHLALELQSLIGNDVSFGRVVPSGDEGVWWLIVEYQEEQVGLRAMKDAVRIVHSCIAGEDFDIKEIMAELLSLFESSRLGPSTGAIVEEARRRGYVYATALTQGMTAASMIMDVTTAFPQADGEFVST